MGPAQVDSLIEYEGHLVSEVECAKLPSHTHVKLFKRQWGTPQPAATFHGVDGRRVREAVVALRASRAPGAAARMAQLGLGALSDGVLSRLAATTVVVRDELRMFLVPRRELSAGDAITHYYNYESLVNRSGA